LAAILAGCWLISRERFFLGLFDMCFSALWFGFFAFFYLDFFVDFFGS